MASNSSSQMAMDSTNSKSVSAEDCDSLFFIDFRDFI